MNYIQLPLQSRKTVDILQSIIQFVKLISVTELGGNEFDYRFGFRILDYEFEGNIPSQLNIDMSFEIKRQITAFNYLASQIKHTLFYYFPISKDFVKNIEIRYEEIQKAVNGKESRLSNSPKLEIIIKFDTPVFASRIKNEDFKICLNNLRIIE
jgi:hypothetical protein